MAGDDVEDSQIQTEVKNGAGYQSGFSTNWTDGNNIPPDGSTQDHWPPHSYTKFLAYAQQAESDMTGAVNNAQVQAQSAGTQAASSAGLASSSILMKHVTDIAGHMASAGSYATAVDAASAYAATLKAAKGAIVAAQMAWNGKYATAGGVINGAVAGHQAAQSMPNGNHPQGAVIQCSQCPAQSASNEWQSDLQEFNQLCEDQVKAVASARQAMLRALDGVASGGQGGQAAAQAAQSGGGMGGMGGMAGMMAGMMQGVAQALQVPASMISNLAQQGPQMLAGIIGEAVQAGAQGGGAAPTSAQEKDDVTVVKKQGPKLGDFITNQKKPIAPVVSTGTGGTGGANSKATVAKPTIKARPKLKVAFDPDAASGWGTTAASADVSGVGKEAERVKVPFRKKD